MTKFANNFDSSVKSSVVGVVLVNLGTPDSPDSSSVRQFLRQFLSDPRVIEVPKPIWWCILYGVILVFRPSRSAAAYKKIWTPEGSPLMVNTVEQVEALQQRLGHQRCLVRHAMSYGEPSVDQVFDELTGLGVQRIVVVPMYPQYSGTTVGSVFDSIGKVLQHRRYVPSIRFVSGYEVHESYIGSLAASIQEHWSEHGRAERLLMSFHGIPQEYADKGDPYDLQCRQTAKMLADQLSLDADSWQLSFQSRVGAKPWLQPYTDDALLAMAKEGITSVDAICPGFSVDCLETLEEVNMEYNELFLNAGGKSFNYIPCLNARPSHIEMLHNIVFEAAGSWLQ